MLKLRLIFFFLHFANSSDDSRPPTPIIATVENDNQDKVLPEFEDKAPTPTHVLEESRPWSPPPRAVEADDFAQPAEELAEEAPNVENINDNVDQSTIVHNEEGTFALLPVDASAVRGKCSFLEIYLLYFVTSLNLIV